MLSLISLAKNYKLWQGNPNLHKRETLNSKSKKLGECATTMSRFRGQRDQLTSFKSKIKSNSIKKYMLDQC